MKGIVVEIDNNNAVILADDGLFTKIRNHDYEIGQTINIKEIRRSGARMIAGIAGMVAAIAVCTAGGFAYFTPTDYVSLDVNPSVEYSVNVFDRILDVKAVNDDGKAILSSLDLNNMTIEDAVKATLDRLIADGYITDDPNGGVVITTSNEELEEAEQLAAELEEEIQAYLDSREGIYVDVEAEAVGLERVSEARELGVTPGKLNLVEKLQKSTNGAIERGEWLTMPVKEINKAIKENRKLEKETAAEADQIKQEGGASVTGSDRKGNQQTKQDTGRSNIQDKTENSRAVIDDVQQSNKEKDTKENVNKVDTLLDDSEDSKKNPVGPPIDEIQPDVKDQTGNGNQKDNSDKTKKQTGGGKNKDDDQ